MLCQSFKIKVAAYPIFVSLDTLKEQVWRTCFEKKKQQQKKKLKLQQSHNKKRKKLRTYSFCAVFLFRFINRNRNRRVQKERLSFERNNFHGNKMAQCLISNWIGKSTKTLYENEIRKKNTGDFLDRLLSSPTPLSSSFFLVSLRTCIHGYQQEMESCCCVDSRPFRRGKRWERCGTRRGIVCWAFRRSWGGTSTKARAQKIVFQAAHEDKERNENVDAPA